MSAGRVEFAVGARRRSECVGRSAPWLSPVGAIMRAVVLCLVVSAASTANSAPKEVCVTPWLAYGTALGAGSCFEPNDAYFQDRRAAGDLTDQHMSAGVEVVVSLTTRVGVLASVDRSVVGEWCGSLEAELTAASAGLLVITDRTGRVRWDQGFSFGLMWPDPWGRRSANLLARWRVASALQVQRLVAVEIAGGLQADTGDFRGMRGPFARIGLRLGSRLPS